MSLNKSTLQDVIDEWVKKYGGEKVFDLLFKANDYSYMRKREC